MESPGRSASPLFDLNSDDDSHDEESPAAPAPAATPAPAPAPEAAAPTAGPAVLAPAAPASEYESPDDSHDPARSKGQIEINNETTVRVVGADIDILNLDRDWKLHADTFDEASAWANSLRPFAGNTVCRQA